MIVSIMSDDDIHTPPNSGDECEGNRRAGRGILVGKETNLSRFEWKVGHRFASRDDYQEVIANYVVMQGRNLFVVISNKARR